MREVKTGEIFQSLPSYAMKFILFLLSTLTASAVPFFDNPAYTRDEPTNPAWFVSNNGQPSKLYYNGVYQSHETGTNDLGLIQAWSIHSNRCRRTWFAGG